MHEALEWAELKASEEDIDEEESKERKMKLKGAQTDMDQFVCDTIRVPAVVKVYKTFMKMQKNCQILTSEVQRFDVLVKQDKLREEKAAADWKQIEKERLELEQAQQEAKTKHEKTIEDLKKVETACSQLNDDRKRLKQDV